MNPCIISINNIRCFINDFTIGKIITKYFTIEESYTRTPVINVNDTKFLLVSVTFERDFSYEGTCLLKYGEYRNGTLRFAPIDNNNYFYTDDFTDVDRDLVDDSFVLDDSGETLGEFYNYMLKDIFKVETEGN